MRIRLVEAIADYNRSRPKAEKMTKVKLSTLIDYDRMKTKTIKEYLSHYDKGTYNCPLLILVQIKKILGFTYETLLEW